MSNGTTSGIRVVTDSSCDLPADLANEFAIKIVPLTIRFGAEEFVDREELDNATFWDRLVRSEVLPETAAPSSGAFAGCFQSLVDDGATGIICINLSSHLSATMQSAQVAARSLDGLVPIAVIDSLSASMGVGNLCLDAARLASEGADVPSIVENLTASVKRTRLVASLATLEYLRKGGRIGTAKAMLGSMLSIKPTIEVVDGLVTEAGKVRTRSKAIQALAERVKEGPFEHLCVLQGAAPDHVELVDLLSRQFPGEKIGVSEIGPVIGTHTGPGVLGVTWQVPPR